MAGILFAIMGIILLTIGLFYLSPSLNKHLKIFGISEINFMALAAIGTLLIAIANFILLPMTLRSNQRSEMLFGAQMMPLVQTKPFKFAMGPTPGPDGQWYGTTYLKVVNYSNFKAYNVRTDVKYHSVWIGEWLKAAMNDLKQKELKDKKNFSKQDEHKLIEYSRIMKENISNIDPESAPAVQAWSGGCLPREKISNRELIISVRTTWENERGFQFDTIDRYTLTLVMVGDGEAFNFIPESIGTPIGKLF